MKTIITHFYNEEFLLPLWLNHHKYYFDHGILINYGSTDNSVQIIKQICPTWEIVDSKHEYFDHQLCDQEIIEIEHSKCSSWRSAITVSEFLVGNLDKLMYESDSPIWHLLPVVKFVGYDPNGHIDNTTPLWYQVTKGIPHTVDNDCRSLQNCHFISYPSGRHFWNMANTTEAMVFKYANCLIGPEMIDRKLQIQHKVSKRDKEEGYAAQHFYDKINGLNNNNLKNFYTDWVESKNPIECVEYIKNIDK